MYLARQAVGVAESVAAGVVVLSDGAGVVVVSLGTGVVVVSLGAGVVVVSLGAGSVVAGGVTDVLSDGLVETGAVVGTGTVGVGDGLGAGGTFGSPAPGSGLVGIGTGPRVGIGCGSGMRYPPGAMTRRATRKLWWPPDSKPQNALTCATSPHALVCSM